MLLCQHPLRQRRVVLWAHSAVTKVELLGNAELLVNTQVQSDLSLTLGPGLTDSRDV